MIAKSYHMFTPPIFRSPINFLLPRAAQFRPNATTAQPIPILTDNRVSAQEVDETVAFWDYQFLFMSQRLEMPHPIKLKLVEGALPDDFPSGTYYLIGPGLFIDDYGSKIHPLDGHGYLRAFEIDGPKGEVRFSAKYVKTEAQMEECDPISGAWRFTHRGPFSVLKGDKMITNTKVMKNVANTSILKWDGRLFCLWEGGTPYEIDPYTLDTLGSLNFINDHGEIDDDEVYKATTNQSHAWDLVARILKPILQGVFKMPPKRLLSHYKVDAQRRRLIVMACNAEDMVLPRSHYTFYGTYGPPISHSSPAYKLPFEFDQSFKLLQKKEFSISDHSMIHDWAFTDTHYILFTNHVKLDILGSMAAIVGQAPMISALSVNQSKPTSSIYLLPRFAPKSDNCDEYYWRRPIEAPQLWLLHVANAYENFDDDGNLTVQIQATVCAYQWFTFHNMFGYNWQNDKLDPSIMNSKRGREQLLPHLIEVSIMVDKSKNNPKCFITSLNKQAKSSDFPIINPAYWGYKHRFVYTASSSGSHKTLSHFPFDTIMKLDNLTQKTNAWTPGNRRFVGEPMFVSKGPFGEDNGYLLVIEYIVSHRRCNLVILDSQQLGEAGALVARFEVPKSLTFPLGFHGMWTAVER